MARIRSVYPAICEDQDLANVSAQAERTFVRLWTHLDDEGRCEDRPRLIAARLYPEHDDMDTEAVERDIEELASHGLLIRYEVDGRKYLSAKPTTWAKYQKPKHFKASELPAPTLAPVVPDPGTASPEMGNHVPETLHVVVGVDVDGVVDVDGGSGPVPVPVAESFEAFWERYPRHHVNGKPGGGASKAKTETIWKRLTPENRELSLVAVCHYADASQHPNAPFPAHATTWLNEKRWFDWQEPADYSNARGPAPPKDRFAEMAERFQQREAVTNGQANGSIDEARRGLPAGQRS